LFQRFDVEVERVQALDRFTTGSFFQGTTSFLKERVERRCRAPWGVAERFGDAAGRIARTALRSRPKRARSAVPIESPQTNAASPARSVRR
jgi:hypothetical protein